ncbi:hypothetical protein J5J86_18530 [Aquabacter sp. L1I39]|uniref:hypothetical protein n=1 Tax=Aquabacter sp. L1I39 TaxID=2820278 RepID=UPI001ADB8AC9|nr:hypothetical protein [Aquabacter sp. L1I39]QTL02754.1 hypothetical protein J5J86_18530 [Aquabacter sp. L1I39]
MGKTAYFPFGRPVTGGVFSAVAGLALLGLTCAMPRPAEAQTPPPRQLQAPLQIQAQRQAQLQTPPASATSRPPAAPAETLAEAIRALSDGTVQVSVALSELGIARPINLSGTDSRRSLFLPVPSGIPIKDAVVTLDARYLRGDGGRTTVVAYVDGTAQWASAPSDPEGVISTPMSISGRPRNSGFVELSVAWASMVAEQVCFDDRSIGNVLELQPTTRLTYSYDRNAVLDLTTAWTALPARTRVLMAPGVLSQQSFDASWRIGTVLERGGKRVVFTVLPSVGSEVDLTGLTLPPPLRAIPAFAALQGGGRHVIKDAAELGALLMVAGHGPVVADVVVSDAALRTALSAAMDALRVQMAAAGPEPLAAFEAWRAQNFTAERDVTGRNLNIAMLGGRSVIAVDAAAAGPASGVLSDTWRRTLQVPAVKVDTAVARAPGDSRAIPLSRLGGVSASFDVLVRGDWSATFDIGKAVTAGGLPSRLDLDLAAAPSAASSQPVASVFLNDYLLGARSLGGNGGAERLSVDVPYYALAPVNVLRVSFQRQPMGDRCRETPQPFPVAVLPSSRLVSDNTATTTDFVGVLARLSGPLDVIVPAAYLQAPLDGLPRMVSVMVAAGVSPEQGKLTVAPASGAVKPGANFVSFDAAVDGAARKVRVEGDRLILVGEGDRTLLDLTGLDRVAVIQAMASGERVGLDYRSLGGGAGDATFQLGTGDVAVVAGNGTVAQINTQSAAEVVAQRPWDYVLMAWNERATWGPIAVGVAIVLFFALLLAARAMRRRNRTGGH